MDLSLNCHTLFIQICSSQRCYPIYLHAPLVIVFIKTVLCSLFVSYFQTTFSLCKLFYRQRGRFYSHQKQKSVTFAALVFQLFVYLSMCIHLSSHSNKLCPGFPPSSPFIISKTFLFFPIILL